MLTLFLNSTINADSVVTPVTRAKKRMARRVNPHNNDDTESEDNDFHIAIDRLERKPLQVRSAASFGRVLVSLHTHERDESRADKRTSI